MGSGRLMVITLATPKDIESLIARADLRSPVSKISQREVDRFCELSGDGQRIHRVNSASDPVIVPGNMLVARLPGMIQAVFTVEMFSHCFTAAYRDVKFLQPLHVDEIHMLQLQIQSVRAREDQTFVKMHCELVSDAGTAFRAQLTDIYFNGMQ
ncbi:MAG: MaoC family dehydratase [Pseudomonadota bacterium]